MDHFISIPELEQGSFKIFWLKSDGSCRLFCVGTKDISENEIPEYLEKHKKWQNELEQKFMNGQGIE